MKFETKRELVCKEITKVEKTLVIVNLGLQQNEKLLMRKTKNIFGYIFTWDTVRNLSDNVTYFTNSKQLLEDYLNILRIKRNRLKM